MAEGTLEISRRNHRLTMMTIFGVHIRQLGEAANKAAHTGESA